MSFAAWSKHFSDELEFDIIFNNLPWVIIATGFYILPTKGVSRTFNMS